MFHSAGYFRAIPCPFFERGLCQRVHCHYRHARPDTKAVERKDAPSVRTGSSQEANANRRPRSKSSAAKAVGGTPSSRSSGPSNSSGQEEAKEGVSHSKKQGAASSHNIQNVSEGNQIRAPTNDPPTDATPAGDGSPPEREFTSADDQSIDQTMLEIFGTSGDEDEGQAGEDEDLQTEEQAGADLAKIESDFIKATQATTDGTAATSHFSQRDTPLTGLKRKRMAHLNAPMLRDTKPVRINPKKAVTSGFSAALDPMALQTHSHKKRVVRTEETSALKRPSLPLTINARVPTKVRQKFLDAYIDEYLNMGRPAQEAYTMGLEREKQNHDRSISHMAYMNTSANQLRRLRAEVKVGMRSEVKGGAGSETKVGTRQQDTAAECYIEKEETTNPYGRGGTKRKEKEPPGGMKGKEPLGGRKGKEPPGERKKERTDPVPSALGGTEGTKGSEHQKRQRLLEGVGRVRTAQDGSREERKDGGGGGPTKEASRMKAVELVRKKLARGAALERQGEGSAALERSRSPQGEGMDVSSHGGASLGKSKLLDRPVKRPKLAKDSKLTTPELQTSSPDDDASIAEHPHYHPRGASPVDIDIVITTSSNPSSTTISPSQFYSKPVKASHTTTTTALENHQLKRKNSVGNRSNSSRGSSSDLSGGSGDLSAKQQQASMAADMAADMAELFGTSDSEQEVWEPPDVSFETALTINDSCAKKSQRPSGKAALQGKSKEKQDKGGATLHVPHLPTPPVPDHTHQDKGHLTDVQIVATSQQAKATSVLTESCSLAPPPGGLINLTELASRYKGAGSQAQDGLKSLKKVRRKAITPAKPLPPPPTYTILKKKTDFVVTGPIFYDYMKTYLLTEEQLVTNGYPRPTAQEGTVSIVRRELDSAITIQPVGPNAMRHMCARCGKPFIIYNSGGYQSVEECSYHFGRLRKTKECGEGFVSVFSCCQGRQDSLGCQVAKMHVTAGEQPSQESGYVQSLPAPAEPGYTPTVYSVDCEMSYTTKGLELTRVTVIDMGLQSVYEMLVKPSYPIVDYNTKFSGLTAESLASVETRLEDVQRQLLGLFYEDTILVGHSLESDLRALKFTHSAVVDTALVFPHPRGLPYKRALKSLIAEHLHRFIQDNIDGGHDSHEDAAACMELMLWKVKTDMLKKTRR